MDIQLIVLIACIALAIFLYFKFFKCPSFGAVTMITGGVKCGKSALTVKFALASYRRVLIRYYLQCFFAKIFRKQKPEKPLIYSNIPLYKVKYVPLTKSQLLREHRLNYGSIVILDEASLVADSMLIKDADLNVKLLKFFKLFGHETHGGKLFINSHCISDLHYSMKRCCSSYYYVHSLVKIPFLSFFKVREERFSDDGTVVNNYDQDVDKSMLRIAMFNSTYKRYDAFCYSVLTDNLPVSNTEEKVTDRANLKQDNITSFRSDINKFN